MSEVQEFSKSAKIMIRQWCICYHIKGDSKNNVLVRSMAPFIGIVELSL